MVARISCMSSDGKTKIFTARIRRVGKVIISVRRLTPWRGGTYLGRGTYLGWWGTYLGRGTYFGWGGGGYLPWLGGLPTLARGYQPWTGGGGGVPNWPEQNREYLLRGGWYASCVHAGGLSCLVLMIIMDDTTKKPGNCLTNLYEKYGCNAG